MKSPTAIILAAESVLREILTGDLVGLEGRIIRLSDAQAEEAGLALLDMIRRAARNIEVAADQRPGPFADLNEPKERLQQAAPPVCAVFKHRQRGGASLEGSLD